MKPYFSQMAADHIAKMEQFTSVPGRQLLVDAGLLPTAPPGAVILDNACGAGIVAQLLFDGTHNEEMKLICGDVAEPMVGACKERIAKKAWNAEAAVFDAQAIPYPENHFTHALINFGIQFVPDAELAMKEMFRVLRPDGVLGITSWTQPGWMPSMVAGIPGFAAPPRFSSHPTCSKEGTLALLAAAGFDPDSVVITPIEFSQREQMDHYLREMPLVFKDTLVGETAEVYGKYMRENYGDDEFELTWKAAVITAKKPAV